MSKIEVDQVDPQSGTTLTLGTSGDTVSIPSGVTLANSGTVTGIPTSALSGTIATAQIADDAVTLAKMAPGTDGNLITYDASGNPVAVATGSAGQVLTSAGAGAPPTFAAASGGSNSSQFSAYGAAGQSLSTNTYTKINIVNEFFDVDSDYDASNSKFVAPSAGKYFLYGQVAIRRTGTFTGNPCQMTVRIYQNGNGTDYIGTTFGSTDGSRVHTIAISAVINASANDYFEVYGRHDKGASETTGGESLFQGFKLIS
jgi:hypothetical protein